jgi:hypothetical protein
MAGYLQYAEHVPGGAPRPGDHVEVLNQRAAENTEDFDQQGLGWTPGVVMGVDLNFDIWVCVQRGEKSTVEVYDFTSFPPYRLVIIGYTCAPGWYAHTQY